jgi:vanillin dehydrogenase
MELRGLSILWESGFGSDEAQMPLGGMKASGYGRFGGQPGVNEFTDVQWITIEDPKQHYPI